MHKSQSDSRLQDKEDDDVKTDGATNGAIRIFSETVRAIPRGHVGARLRGALTRTRGRRMTASVTFSDVNGPKGGADVRCALQFRLAGRPPISAIAVGTTPRLAFDAAYGRAWRRLDRAIEQARESARHPKKYYAARRIVV